MKTSETKEGIMLLITLIFSIFTERKHQQTIKHYGKRMANTPLLQKRTGTSIRTRHLHGSRTKPPGLVDKDEHTAHRSVEADELPGHTTHVHFPTSRLDLRVFGRTLKQGVPAFFKNV